MMIHKASMCILMFPAGSRRDVSEPWPRSRHCATGSFREAQGEARGSAGAWLEVQEAQGGRLIHVDPGWFNHGSLMGLSD